MTYNKCKILLYTCRLVRFIDKILINHLFKAEVRRKMKKSKILPERITHALALNDMTQKELAESGVIAREYLNTICTGKNDRNQNKGTIRAIADALGVVPEYLTGETAYINGGDGEKKDKHFIDSVRFRTNWSKIQLLFNAYDYDLKINFKTKRYTLLEGTRVVKQDAPLGDLEKVYDSFLSLYDVGLNILLMAFPDR